MSQPSIGGRGRRRRATSTIEGLLAPCLTVAALVAWRDSTERLDPYVAALLGLALACAIGGFRNNEGARRLASGVSLLILAVPTVPLAGSLAWYLVRWAWSGRQYLFRLVGA